MPRLKTKTITPLSIAQDALSLLDAKHIAATRGTYFSEPFDTHGSIREYLNAPDSTPCTVCALGALFCGLVENGQDYNFQARPLIGHNEGGPLSAYFTPEQLSQIESSFEGWGELGGATRNYRRNRRNDETLRAILNNIIEGNGVFDPTR